MTRFTRAVRKALPDILCVTGVACVAVGLLFITPVLALGLVGAYLYWVGSTAGRRR